MGTGKDILTHFFSFLQCYCGHFAKSAKHAAVTTKQIPRLLRSDLFLTGGEIIAKSITVVEVKSEAN